MRHSRLAVLALALPLALPLAGTAYAADSASANLESVPLNGSDGSGTGMVTVDGNQIEFSLAASGLADGPHAAHIHFGADARHECPRAGEDKNGDNRLNTTEGQPAYGPIVVSLTKTGDTSDKSGLAVKRFATGKSIKYSRGGVTVAPAVAKAITNGQAVVVVHGVAYTDERKNAKSDLMASLPASATDPAICGILNASPAGGAATGAGGAVTSSQSTTLIALGGAALMFAAGAGTLVARRVRGE